MKLNKLKPLSLLFIYFLLIKTASCQEILGTSGGESTGSNGSIAYSIGQTAYKTNIGATGSVIEGIQHYYEIKRLNVEENKLSFQTKLFPNPTSSYLFLQIGNYKNDALSYQIFDIQGRIIKRSQITSNKTQIDMASLPNSSYILCIIQNNKKTESFKIIKTN